MRIALHASMLNPTIAHVDTSNSKLNSYKVRSDMKNGWYGRLFGPIPCSGCIFIVYIGGSSLLGLWECKTQTRQSHCVLRLVRQGISPAVCATTGSPRRRSWVDVPWMQAWWSLKASDRGEAPSPGQASLFSCSVACTGRVARVGGVKLVPNYILFCCGMRKVLASCHKYTA
jgi:hypothetical protein